jgi:hypothetical protein
MLSILSLWLQSSEAFPPLGTIDFYGLHKVSEAQIRQSLSFHEGDTIDTGQFAEQKPATEQKLATIPRVQAAFVSLVCCTDGQKSMLYVGIQEVGTACSSFRPAPHGAMRLTDDVVQAGKDEETAFEKAVLKGDAGEGDTQGHALFHDSATRAVQLHFLTLAQAHFSNLRDVLRNSSDAEQRALAAEVLGYEG